MSSSVAKAHSETLRTLPGDDVRQIMWRFADRFDLQMVVQSTRAVARGPVARLVAAGARSTHEWTQEKASLLKAFDEAGITAVFLDPEHGGFIQGPKNLALALVAFELAWVDAGAATSSLATCLALAPIHERGTPEQARYLLHGAVFRRPQGEDRKIWRAAFALTEPIPYVGVETGLLNGKSAHCRSGKKARNPSSKSTSGAGSSPTWASPTSSRPRWIRPIRASRVPAMIILEENDPGTFDRGTPTRKLVHQLSSTNDPVLSLRVPASRIVGGVQRQGRRDHPPLQSREVIEAVFRRTRVTVGIMTSAKLLSAIEPVIRYHRGRFRGGEAATPGTPRYELGLQMKEDVLHRLVDVWATGEASASLGFAAARLFDELDPLERQKEEIFARDNVGRGTAALKAMRRYQKEALDCLQTGANCDDPMVRFVLLDSLANVLCPACKLWNTGHGANMMREAVSLMGGYGITEDCPGFLGHKWMDAQLEATYEGPEAVQRRQLSVTMTNELFLAQFHRWIAEMREIGSRHPGTGACTLATAMHLWLWTLNHLQKATDAEGVKLYQSSRQGVTFPLADALCWLLAARYFILDVLELAEKGPAHPVVAEGLPGLLAFYTDLCHVQCARAAGEVGRVTAELVFGYRRHPAWDEETADACYREGELVALEGIIPGLASTATDTLAEDGSHPFKAGPCVRFEGYEQFVRLRARLDGCLTGAQLAKDRAAEALTKVMIPEALDYPA
jgi:alkylation response protein AidB-like acyl-CoA dehydrogenase